MHVFALITESHTEEAQSFVGVVVLKKEEILRSYTAIKQYFRRYRRSRFLATFICMVVFGLVSLATVLYADVTQVYAAAVSNCSGREQSYTVVRGDTLSGIAARYGVNWSSLASRNSIANPNLIFAGQHLCVARKGVVSYAPAVLSHTLASSLPASSSVAGMINSVFGPYAGSAIRIATCESGLNPNATNPLFIGGSRASGVFQILYPSTWFGTSRAGFSPYNAYANIVAAHEIFVRDGYSWREWVCQA
jgi:LysM repeat protein